MPNVKKTKYDLEERTGKFGEKIIEFAKKIPKTPVTVPLISQLVKAGTSVGANYCEADCAESKKDFEHKLGICKKESKESKHWSRMIAVAVPELKDEAIQPLFSCLDDLIHPVHQLLFAECGFQSPS
jgi:four helix bundle protein